MQCPNADGELEQKIHQKEGLVITYHQCPVCDGSWLDAFNTNYLKTEDIPQTSDEPTSAAPIQPTCPVCNEALTITHGDNIPQNVQTWKCPNNHGYFFPKGELFKFKRAQEAKINYFKLWSIPLPNVASVLLAIFIFFIVSASLVNVGQRQIYQLQAQNILQFQEAFVADTSVTIAATTTSKTTATLHIGPYEQSMQTKDYILHTLFLSHLTGGTYEYFFTFLIDGKTVRSNTFTFIIQ